MKFNNEILWASPPNTEIDLHEVQQLPNNNYMSFIPIYELGPIVEDDRWSELFQNLGYQADGETIEFPWLGQKIVEWDKNTGEEAIVKRSTQHGGAEGQKSRTRESFEGPGHMMSKYWKDKLKTKKKKKKKKGHNTKKLMIPTV